MKIVPTERLEWPPPYKSATEKYAPQVQLAPDGELQELRGRAAVSVPRSERSANRDQGDVEFQLPSAIHRRCDIRDVEIASYRAQLAPVTGRAFHHRQFRILQQHGPHRGQSDPDRSAKRRRGHPLSLRRVSVPGAGGAARLRSGSLRSRIRTSTTTLDSTVRRQRAGASAYRPTNSRMRSAL